MAFQGRASKAPKTETTQDGTADATAVLEAAGLTTTPPEQQQVATRPVDALVPEVMTQASAYDSDTMRELSSFDEAVRLATEAYGPIDDAADLGDGFALLKEEDKRRLVGIPLLFLEWNFYPGDYGSMFVAIRMVARNKDGGVSKYIVNDGSTGIADQLAAYTKRTGKSGGLMVRQGFRVSEYTYCELCGAVKCMSETVHRDSGAHKKAETYYVDTSA